jgi:hypothetical protein
MKKKIFSMIGSILILIALTIATGCGGDTSSNSPSNPLPQPSVDCGGEECIK